MTDEEREKLCVRLRTEGTGVYEAADEIERLADLVDDYKLVFGEILKTELEEMKARIEAYDRGDYD